ncbi:hypothetical protein DVR12_18575 [Chitinophaga silvatica]|uniref:Late embryogenesis abundant protein LEA-2 subgroup domain-containing protein n=1 Tax=Chitinophaga silvatica TaxID=2282649 RepID=A0A3E1Y6P6_9BACT|nr:LEA type 2 family protein [Chitinophaga silvatica]RFS20568.1 hypothetical protein DVR12_18575 [Chitinophaga silvatica]
MKIFKIFIAVILVAIIAASCEKNKDIQFVRVAGISMDEIGMSKSIVSMTLAYYNPNNYRLQLKDAKFDIFIDDTEVGHSMQDTTIAIPARDTFYFPVKLEINMANVMKNAMSLLGNSEVTIKAMGNCKVGKAGIFVPFPIKCETKQKLNFF